jgi:hypothetical protein
MKPIPGGALSSLRSHDVTANGATTVYRSHFELNGWLRVLVLALFRDKLEKGFAAMTRAVGQRAERLWVEQRR